MQIGHRILLAKWQLALNIRTPKTIYLTCSWGQHEGASTRAYKSLGDYFARISVLRAPYLWASLPPLWAKSWCFTQGWGSATRLIKGNVSCCRISTGRNTCKTMLISSPIHSTCLCVLHQHHLEAGFSKDKYWVMMFLIKHQCCFLHQFGIEVYEIMELDFSVFFFQISCFVYLAVCAYLTLITTSEAMSEWDNTWLEGCWRTLQTCVRISVVLQHL